MRHLSLAPLAARSVTSIETRLQIEHGATQVLSECTTLAEAAPRIIATACDALGWECGAAWTLDVDPNAMRCAGMWAVPAPRVEEFLAQVRHGRPSRHGGLVGRTWLAGEPVWLRDVTIDPTFRRAPLALKAGLHSALAFPIKAGSAVLGVMEFFSREIHEPDAALLDCMRYVGSQIGQFCQRTEAQELLRASEERFHDTFELAAIGIAHVDPGGRFIRVNRWLCDLLGYTREELLGLTVKDVSHPEDRDLTDGVRDQLRAAEIHAFQKEKRYLRKDGSIVWVGLTVTLKRAPSGEPLYDISVIEDISARKRSEEELRRFRVALDNSADMIVLIDRRTMRYIDANDSTCRLLGYSRQELLSLGPHDVLPASRAALERAYDDLIRNPGAANGMVSEYRRKDGSTFPFESTRHVIPSGDSHVIVAISRDITERKQAEQRIRYLATHDALTELPNRVMFGQMLHHAIDSARRYNRRFAVLFIDLDRFKVINDTLGHEAGDQLLQTVSSRLKGTLRASDVVARLGGDEFVVLVQEVQSAQQVQAVARKILSALIRPIEIAGHECRVTGSIGISMFPADATDERSLMKNADAAMYVAKEQGKNNYHFYTRNLKSSSLERMALETNLRRALERDELSLHYQAKQDLRTGAIVGVEALLRWNCAELGPVSPAQFIPIAEETGLIVAIGKWVMRTACAQSVAWRRQGLPPVHMAVNLSPRQFADPNLLKDIDAVFRETGMEPESLELEITEGMVMHNPERAVTVLRQIKAMGVRLAIDDFGTGYSSLAQLKRFPIDTLKVDRSFIRDIPKDAEDKAITEAIIAMGKTLSLTVVAEGVETEAQRAFLRDHACDQMQGYYFSKPVPAEDFAALLRSHSI